MDSRQGQGQQGAYSQQGGIQNDFSQSRGQSEQLESGLQSGGTQSGFGQSGLQSGQSGMTGTQGGYQQSGLQSGQSGLSSGQSDQAGKSGGMFSGITSGVSGALGSVSSAVKSGVSSIKDAVTGDRSQQQGGMGGQSGLSSGGQTGGQQWSGQGQQGISGGQSGGVYGGGLSSAVSDEPELGQSAVQSGFGNAGDFKQSGLSGAQGGLGGQSGKSGDDAYPHVGTAQGGSQRRNSGLRESAGILGGQHDSTMRDSSQQQSGYSDPLGDRTGMGSGISQGGMGQGDMSGSRINDAGSGLSQMKEGMQQQASAQAGGWTGAQGKQQSGGIDSARQADFPRAG